MKKEIHVVGAVMESKGKILCAQRGSNKALAHLWEFPGGKIEAGESKRDALEREIREELLCEIKVIKKITTTRYEYDFGIVILTTFECTLTEGLPVLTEHQELKWLPREMFETVEWAPADIPTIHILKGKKIKNLQR